jgi:hypothetical protein
MQNQDPTVRRATAADVLRDIMQALYFLPSSAQEVMRLRFGLTGGEPLPVDQVAAICGRTPAEVRRIEAEAIRSLRQPHIAGILQNYIRDGVDRVPLELRQRISGDVEFSPLVWCDRHGWQDPGVSTGADRACGMCPCPIVQAGRNAAYCSDGCRQAAYRRRTRGSLS